MPLSVASQIGASPSLKWAVAAMGFHIVNAFLGAFMAFVKKKASLTRVHRLLYFTVLFCLGYFLVLNGIHSSNSPGEYLVCLYFITLIPLSKRWDAMLHAFVSIVGLILLPLLILLNVDLW